MIESFPLAAYSCDVDAAVVCCDQKCLKFWVCGPSLRSDGTSTLNHSMLCQAAGCCHPTFLPPAIALQDPPRPHGLKVDIAQQSGQCKVALIDAPLAVNECGTMLGVVCALVDQTRRAKLRPRRGHDTATPFYGTVRHRSREAMKP